MALYAIAQLTTGTAAASAAIELRASASDRLEVREIGLTLNAATATTLGLGRPGAIGVTPTSPLTLVAQDTAASAATAQTALAWGTGPTIPGTFLRRAAFPATIGAGIIWSFGPGELVIPASGSLIVWNIVLGSALNCWFVVDE